MGLGLVLGLGLGLGLGVDEAPLPRLGLGLGLGVDEAPRPTGHLCNAAHAELGHEHVKRVTRHLDALQLRDQPGGGLGVRSRVTWWGGVGVRVRGWGWGLGLGLGARPTAA